MSEDCVSSADNRVCKKAATRSMANVELKMVFIGSSLVQWCNVSVKFAVMFCRFDVALSPACDVFLFIEGEFAANFCRRAEHK